MDTHSLSSNLRNIRRTCVFRETHGEVLGSENINRTCGFRETHGEVLGSENINRTCGFRETKVFALCEMESHNVQKGIQHGQITDPSISCTASNEQQIMSLELVQMSHT